MCLDKPLWSCKNCGKICSTKGNLKAHEFLHTGERPFECKVCSKKFKAKTTLNNHQVTHTQIRDFECDMCGKSFLTKRNLCTHKDRHNKIKRFFCDICGKGFYLKKDLDIHLKSKRIHSVPCKICKKEFPTRDAYIAHSIIHPELKIRTRCQICNKRMQILTPTKSNNYTCASCKPIVETYLKKPCDSHNKKLKCYICEKTFKSKGCLRVHLQYHVKPKQKCDICNKMYRNLKAHKLEVHEKKKSHKCSLCFKIFSRAFLLKKHYFTHTNERPYTCEACNASFIHSFELKKHIKNKTCDKYLNFAYNCLFCNAKFIKKSALTLHTYQKHFEDKFKRENEHSLHEKTLDKVSVTVKDDTPSKETLDDIKDESAFLPTKSVFKKSVLELYDLIEKRSLKI